MANIAIVPISFELMVEMFHFPEGTKIISAKSSDFMVGVIDFIVEHPDLPETYTGSNIPRVNPRYSKKTDVIETVLFDGWV